MDLKLLKLHQKTANNLQICQTLYYSQLSLNKHVCKTDTSTTNTTEVGPCMPFFSHLLHVNSLRAEHLSRWTVRAGPDGVHLRKR